MKTLGCLLLLFCIAACAGKPKQKKNVKLDWWQTEVIYQIYPRSFKDSNGDGIGDLNGIYEKLPYLKDLGIGAVWFSPIFASPMVDGGYDISNYRDIDIVYGNITDFERVIRRAQKMGIKVLLDLVPNHTSELHDWFQFSVKKIPPYTDYYVWKDAKYVNGTRQPPNNWISVFGKSAWTWNAERGQYYFHQFTPQQPDLNYRSAVVYEEMKNILILWLDRGVDGFRIDAFNFLFEHPDFPDEPRSNKPYVTPDDYEYLDHIYSVDRPETLKVAQDWRAILDRYSKKGRTRFMMAEAYTSTDYVMKLYGTPKKPGFHFPFNFIMVTGLNAESNAATMIRSIKDWYRHMPRHGWANWVLSNHDNSRPATRFGHFLIDGLHMIEMLLPGTAIAYNGDELAMEDTFIRWDQTVDPFALISGPTRYRLVTRDPERTPFQWDDSENAGFTTNLHTWLPVNPGYWKVNAKSESSTVGKTHLHIFKDLIKLRRNIVFQRGDLHMYAPSEWVLVITRSYLDHATYIVVVNLGSEITISNLSKLRPSLPQNLSVVIPSVNSRYDSGDIVSTRSIKLRPKAAVVLTTSVEDWNVSEIGKVDLQHEAFSS